MDDLLQWHGQGQRSATQAPPLPRPSPFRHLAFDIRHSTFSTKGAMRAVSWKVSEARNQGQGQWGDSASDSDSDSDSGTGRVGGAFKLPLTSVPSRIP